MSKFRHKLTHPPLALMINSESLICHKNAYVLFFVEALKYRHNSRLIFERALKFHSQQNFCIGFPVAVHEVLSLWKIAETCYFITLLA